MCNASTGTRPPRKKKLCNANQDTQPPWASCNLWTLPCIYNNAINLEKEREGREREAGKELLGGRRIENVSKREGEREGGWWKRGREDEREESRETTG